MTHAALDISGPRPTVRFERHLEEPPDVVWRALTDAEELKAWFPHDIVTEEWKVGAALTFHDRETRAASLTGTVLELDPPHLLAYTWADDILRFELTPTAAGGTTLVLTDELPSGTAARNAAGWEVCLDRLAGGTHAGNAWKRLFDRYVAAFEPTLGPQEGPPPGYEEGST